MAIEPNTTSRSASFVVVIVGLTVICVGLGAMMFITIEAATAVKDQAARKLLARLAWMSLVLLCLALIMTVWVLLRYVRHRMRDTERPPEPSTYVNAWELAGKRFQLNEDNEPEDPDYLCDDDEDDDDDDDDEEQGPRPKDRWR